MRALTVLLLALIPCACASQRSWSYTPHAAVDAAPLTEKSIAVVPFVERRGDENKNYVGMYLIPLNPTGPQMYDRPEGVQIHITSGQWVVKPSEDFAKAAAAELSAACISEDAFFTYRAADGDLVLRGDLEVMGYDGGIISYGFSFFAPSLWILFPAGYYSNEIRVSMRLEDRETKEEIWSGTYENRMRTKTVWIYKMGSDFQYDHLLRDIMAHAVNDIAKALGATEARIKKVPELVPVWGRREKN